MSIKAYKWVYHGNEWVICYDKILFDADRDCEMVRLFEDFGVVDVDETGRGNMWISRFALSRALIGGGFGKFFGFVIRAMIRDLDCNDVNFYSVECS